MLVEGSVDARSASRPPAPRSMSRLGMLVEGPTEVEFVKRVLARSLLAHGVVVTPVSMDGNVTTDRMARELANLYWSFDAVTSFVDFYGFRHKADSTVEQLEQAVAELARTRIGRRHDASKVVVYVQRHEFEGLLFTDADGFRHAGLAVDEACLSQLRGVGRGFPTPEDINDDSATAPSKRILELIPDFRKRLHGPLVAENVGLAAIRTACPRFGAWMDRLERLAR